MENLWDRIEVIVSGREKLTARPIEFKYDKDGNPTVVLRYETTCPICGELVQFNTTEMITKEGYQYINCHCVKEIKTKTSVNVLMQRPGIEVLNDKKIVKKEVKVEEGHGCPFIDPIEAGLFDPIKIEDAVKEKSNDL